MDAKELAEEFIRSYRGMFGPFTLDGDSDYVSASASSPDGDSTSIIRYEVVDDPDGEFENRKQFILSKAKRLGPMGKLKEFDCPGAFDRCYGRILNFKLLGKEGGFFFFAATKGNVLVFIQAYSTTGKGQIPDSERDGIILGSEAVL